LNDGGGLLTLSGALRGAGGVVKRGTNLVTLLPANPNSYAGGTVVEQGVLTLGFADGALNVGTIRGPVTVQTGAVLRVSVSKGIGFGGSSSGNVTVVHLNEALLDYTGNTGGLGGGQPVYLPGQRDPEQRRHQLADRRRLLSVPDRRHEPHGVHAPLVAAVGDVGPGPARLDRPLRGGGRRGLPRPAD
jgi:autotransporter-associated beta strand protein